ncbi:hypothetical protein AAG570_004018 [Ranatra chinensis]|uniref:fructose-bisphosphatase n=1 Tax=Ranatra chinensis TaxID=642074 RepID=A0ABD0YH32_9HEMI
MAIGLNVIARYASQVALYPCSAGKTFVTTYCRRTLFNVPLLTLNSYILSKQREVKEATGEFTQLILAIQTAIKEISDSIRKAGIIRLYGLEGSENVHGERKQKLDVFANDLFVSMCIDSYATCLIVSEELEEPAITPIGKRGKYIMCFDPLDGSSNIECLAPIGSIFGIYKKSTQGEPTDIDALQKGNMAVAAGYAMYSGCTALVLGIGQGVNGFTLNASVGEFYLCDPNMKIPQASETYSINEGYTANWDDAIQEFVMRKKNPKQKKVYSCRYIGTLIADAHRILKHGGIFLYPQTKEHPTGKLKLLFKCNPLAFIMEHAGGTASNGKSPILDIVPEKQSQKSPFYVGCHSEMTSLLQIIASHRRHGPKGQI